MLLGDVDGIVEDAVDGERDRVCVGQVQGDGLERDVGKHGVYLLSLGGEERERERGGGGGRQ